MDGSVAREGAAELLQRLGQKSHFSHLHSLLKDIYWSEAEVSPEAAQAMKEQFKLILLSLVDEIWTQDAKKQETDRKPSGKKPSQREIRASPQSDQAVRRSSPTHSSPRATLRSTPSTAVMQFAQARTYEELYSMSDFAHISSAGTFQKAQRERRIQQSPGPSDYNSDFLTIRKQSPRAVIPRGEKRLNYIPQTDSPGPGHYYPMRRYVSKG